jgi:hypothetical protein
LEQKTAAMAGPPHIAPNQRHMNTQSASNTLQMSPISVTNERFIRLSRLLQIHTAFTGKSSGSFLLLRYFFAFALKVFDRKGAPAED